MERLMPVLWSLLVSAEFTRGPKEPAANLSCHQCFKVPSQAQCPPTVCHPTDRVCVSHTVLLLSIKFKWKGRLWLSKRCAPRCPNSNTNYEWTVEPGILGKIVRRCCSGNLCNRAPTIREFPRALKRGVLLGAGLLWVLL